MREDKGKQHAIHNHAVRRGIQPNLRVTFRDAHAHASWNNPTNYYIMGTITREDKDKQHALGFSAGGVGVFKNSMFAANQPHPARKRQAANIETLNTRPLAQPTHHFQLRNRNLGVSLVVRKPPALLVRTDKAPPFPK